MTDEKDKVKKKLEEEPELRRSYAVYFFILSLLLMLSFLWVTWDEAIGRRPWKAYQKEFKKLVAEKLDSKENGRLMKTIKQEPVKIKQVFIPELDVVDRCQSCHISIEYNGFEDWEHPFKGHPGRYLEWHPTSQFGCTPCHRGQGYATTSPQKAHGNVPFWEEPLLTGDFVQASCAGCHPENQVPMAPVLSRGKVLMKELGCLGCHKVKGKEDVSRIGRNLDDIGSKVYTKWLIKWLRDPLGYQPGTRMPEFNLPEGAIKAISANLMSFKDKEIENGEEPLSGNYDRGIAVYRKAMCIDCHVTKTDTLGSPIGGTVGPDLRRIGNKVKPIWLFAFLKNPHIFQPNKKMPRYNFTDRDVTDIVEFILTDWVDKGMLDEEENEPEPLLNIPGLAEKGGLLFNELGCSGCHEKSEITNAEWIGGELTYIGSKRESELDIEDGLNIPKTPADFIFHKIKTPRVFGRGLKIYHREISEQELLKFMWTGLQPQALLFSSYDPPYGSTREKVIRILELAKEAGIIDKKLLPPDMASEDSGIVKWLFEELDKAGAFNALKMPSYFRLIDNEDVEALTIALLSMTRKEIHTKYIKTFKKKPAFMPEGPFGELVNKYKCLSCHGIRGAGEAYAADISIEGSKVRKEWLYEFLRKPYSMRRTLTIAMPLFEFPEEEIEVMIDYISLVLVDDEIPRDYEKGFKYGDRENGEVLFDKKGCLACHKVRGIGGDVGPGFTTEVPGFPVSTWVGDKLKAGWVYRWLKDPQAIISDTIEPNLNLSEEEIRALTAYIMGLKNS